MTGAHSIRHITRWVTPQMLRILAKRAACECCGAFTFGRLCSQCRERAQPHRDGDPYDVVGGEGGGWG